MVLEAGLSNRYGFESYEDETAYIDMEHNEDSLADNETLIRIVTSTISMNILNLSSQTSKRINHLIPSARLRNFILRFPWSEYIWIAPVSWLYLLKSEINCCVSCLNMGIDRLIVWKPSDERNIIRLLSCR